MPVVGVDEVGRGPWAGPVFAAAVVLGADAPAGLNDSKKLTAAVRIRLDVAIRASCRVAVGQASVEEVDRLNILNATHLAMERAVAGLGVAPIEVLVDGNRAPRWRWPTRCIVGGDAIEPAIMAASIVAKVARDALMVALDAAHPGYGWATNKGYGTAEHAAAMARLGVTEHHRRSFAPVRKLISG